MSYFNTTAVLSDAEITCEQICLGLEHNHALLTIDGKQCACPNITEMAITTPNNIPLFDPSCGITSVILTDLGIYLYII